MPLQVVALFRRKAILKYISHIDPDGWPVPRPAFALFPVDRRTMVIGGAEEEGMMPGQVVAACALSRDIIAYQVKGKYGGRRKIAGVDLGTIDIEDVYTASPPLPGKRIESGS
jgi:hypothetical protein